MTGNWTGFFKILLVPGILAACTPGADNHAPDRNFYFEVVTHKHDDFSIHLSDYIKNHIPQNKYTITNQSGLQWPFYKELKPDEDIPRDSLMPPHWFIHRMIPKNPDQPMKIDEYLVHIDLVPQPDTIPNYSVEIFKMDSTGLALSASTGIHYIDSTEFSSPETLADFYLKSIIRYSFK